MEKYFAPGRVNLIGEHLDYNGGLVLPAALTMGISLHLKRRNDNRIVLHSADHWFSKEVDISDDLHYDSKNDWANYPLGVIARMKNENHEVVGCEIFYESNLPERAGLSSSAAMEVVTAYALLKQTESNINGTWLASFCKMVENEFIGVQCGIMDQYAVVLGKENHALLIDCASLKHELIGVDLGDCRLLIMDTKKPRSLIKSAYNQRKMECEEALHILKTSQPFIENLCDAELYHLQLLKDETLKKRARHVVSEQGRVKLAVAALKQRDLEELGRLMNASHASLKNDYEVSCVELDTLVEEAQHLQGCLGARMTGAGFGGCAIALVRKTDLENFKSKVREKYYAVTGLNCEIYESGIGDGVRQLTDYNIL